MIGKNFFERITSEPTSHNSGTTVENVPIESKCIAEIRDFLSDEMNVNAILLTKNNIPAITPFIEYDASINDTVDTAPDQQTEPTSANAEQSLFLSVPHSEHALRKDLRDYYTKAFDTSHIQEALIRRKIQPIHHDAIITQLYDRMIEKTVSAFINTVTQQLTNAGLNEEQAKEYIAWRYTTLSPNEPLHITQTKNGETIDINSFVHDTQVAHFLSEIDHNSPKTSDADHFTSADIDKLIANALKE